MMYECACVWVCVCVCFRVSDVKMPCNFRLWPFDSSGCWLQMWQEGVCVYHVRLCSTSRAINYGVLHIFIEVFSLGFRMRLCMYPIVKRSFFKKCIPRLEENVLGFPFVSWSFCEFVCDRRKQTEKQKSSDREVTRNLLLSCLIYLFLHWTEILITPAACSPGSTAWYHSGGQTILYSSWSTKGSLKGSLGRSGSLLGAPSQCFSDETESACRSPESSPPAVARKYFLKCSYNIFVTEAPHTHMLAHRLSLYLWLIQIPCLLVICWHSTRKAGETSVAESSMDGCTAAPQSISRRDSSPFLN